MNARPTATASRPRTLLLAAALIASAALLSGCVQTIASLFEPHGRRQREAYWQQFSFEDRPMEYQVPSWR
ncbi:MAG: hypothetical protein ACREJO_14690 [Phycisphaerales bacterium]